MDLVQIVFGLVSLAFVLFVPGYCLALAFFPAKKDLEFLERFTFSLVFSITFLPLLVLVENQLLRIPINAVSVWASVTFLILVGLIVYFIRIKRIAVPEQLNKLFPSVEGEAVSLIPRF